METKIVVHMKDGTIYKGVTHDFDADRDTFHVLPAEGGGVPRNVDIDAMKALFYVKDYMGNRDFVARRKFEGSEGASRRAVLKFRDGEEIWGYLESTEAEGRPIGASSSIPPTSGTTTSGSSSCAPRWSRCGASKVDPPGATQGPQEADGPLVPNEGDGGTR